MSIVIRPGLATDATALATLAAETFRETFSADNRPEDLAHHLTHAYGTTQQQRELVDPDITTLLVEVDGQLAGYAQLRSGVAPECVTGESPVELWRFYIAQSWHGRGVAQALMRRVELEAHRRGGRTLWLGVWERNARAKAFYNKSGFVDIGSHVFMVGTDAQTDRIMVRSVPAAITDGGAEGMPWRMSKFVFAAVLALGADSALAQTPIARDPRLPLDSLPVTARVDLPSSADWMAFGFGSVWIVNYRPSRLSRVDATTNRLSADIPLGRNGCLGVVVALDRVWVPTCGDGVVNEIDPTTNSIVRRIAAPIKTGREGAVAFADGALWIPDNLSDSNSASVARLDLRSGAIQGHVSTGKRSDVAVAGFGSVWVSSSAENVVTRIDPATNQVLARIPVGRSPKFMAAGEGAVWVQNRYDGSVSRIDPATNREVARIAAWAPTLAGDIAAGGGAVWLSVNGMPVTRIDPKTNAVTHQYVGGDGIDAIRWGAGALWVADHALGQLWRIDDRRIVVR